MASMWSTSSNPPGRSTVAPSPKEPEEDDEDFAYDFAFGSPAVGEDPEKSGESFLYVPSPERSTGRSWNGSTVEGAGRVMGLGLEFGLSESPTSMRSGQALPSSPPLFAPKPTSPIAPYSRWAIAPYSRWAPEGYIPAPPTNPMKLLKSPGSKSSSLNLSVDAPSFSHIPIISTGPPPVPVTLRKPATAAEQSLADKFLNRLPPGVLARSSAVVEERELHAPTPPPPPSPATVTRSATPSPSAAEELEQLRDRLVEAQRKELVLEAEKAALEQHRKAISAHEEQFDALQQRLDALSSENQALSLKIAALEEEKRSSATRVEELETSLAAAEVARDAVQRRLDEAVGEIVRLEDAPSTAEKAEQEKERAMESLKGLQDTLDRERVRMSAVEGREAELLVEVAGLRRSDEEWREMRREMGRLRKEMEREVERDHRYEASRGEAWALADRMKAENEAVKTRCENLVKAKDPAGILGGGHYCRSTLLELASSSVKVDLSDVPEEILVTPPSTGRSIPIRQPRGPSSPSFPPPSTASVASTTTTSAEFSALQFQLRHSHAEVRALLQEREQMRAVTGEMLDAIRGLEEELGMLRLSARGAETGAAMSKMSPDSLGVAKQQQSPEISAAAANNSHVTDAKEEPIVSAEEGEGGRGTEGAGPNLTYKHDGPDGVGDGEGGLTAAVAADGATSASSTQPSPSDSTSAQPSAEKGKGEGVQRLHAAQSRSENEEEEEEL